MTNHSNIVHKITHSHTHYTHFIICTYTVEYKTLYCYFAEKVYVSILVQGLQRFCSVHLRPALTLYLSHVHLWFKGTHTQSTMDPN